MFVAFWANAPVVDNSPRRAAHGNALERNMAERNGAEGKGMCFKSKDS